MGSAVQWVPGPGVLGPAAVYGRSVGDAEERH